MAAVLNGGILCTNQVFAGCKTIGSASADSPLYPAVLIGKVFLTGALTALAITIVFPAPFSLELGGSVDLATNTTTFHDVPDIPLSELKVTLAGGADAAFATTCATPSGTATARLTTQNGDRTVAVPSAFTVAGCGAKVGGGAGGTTRTGAKATKSHSSGRPQIESASFSGLVRGRPTLSFRLVAGNNAPRLSSFTIDLPRGLSIVRHRDRERLTVAGVTLKGTKIRSIALREGRLVLTLRRPFSGVSVKLRATALKETRGLRQKAKHRRIKSLKLTVITRDVNGRSTTLTALVKKLRL